MTRADYLTHFLADRAEHPDVIGIARAALELFELDQTSELAKSTLVELIAFVRESDDATPDYLGIARGLKKLGPRAVPLYQALLFDALTDSEPANRRIAVDALGAILPRRTELLKSLERSETEVWEPQSVVRRVSVSDFELRGEVLKGLGSAYPEIRLRAAWVSGFLVTPEKEVLSQLDRLKDDPDPRVRQKASEAVKQLGR